MKYFYSLLIALVSSAIYSQTAIIKGSVIEQGTGKSIPGVLVKILNTKLATQTDASGEFIIRNVPVGKQEVQFSDFTLETKIISDVDAIKDETTSLTVSMSEKNNTLNEVVIKKTKMKAESVASLLSVQKNSARVSDGISAETIKRTPDKTASDVLKRISGASVQNNKFVIIRGLNDRYNTTYLNGAPMPSSEPDRKAFSFDIFPANMLDNLVIYKTASPDLSGEFTGGVVEISTKATPTNNFQSVSIGTGYNSITIGKDQLYSKDIKSKLDIPSVKDFKALQNNRTEGNLSQLVSISKNNETDWNLYNKTFGANTSFQYTIGRNFTLEGKESIGILFSLSNSTSNNFNETLRKEFDGPNTLLSNLVDKNYTVQTLSGAILNVSLNLNANNKLSFKNLYSINSEDRILDRSGQLTQEDDPLFTKATARTFTENKLYTGQLGGEHFFSASKIKLNWVGSISNVIRDIPNERRHYYTQTRSADGTLSPLITSFSTNTVGRNLPGSVFTSLNNEFLYSTKFDLSKKVQFFENFSTEFKIGGLMQTRDRVFEARQLGFAKFFGNVGGVNYGGFTFNPQIESQSNATIFNASNMGILGAGSSGLVLYDGSLGNDKYKANSKLNSAYIMIDNSIEKFRFVWGVRMEDFNQNLFSKSDSNQDIVVNNSQLDFLPSANLIFSVNKKQNIRLSASKTVNRPEFRELAPFIFFDNDTRQNTSGLTDLKIASINNYDLRYEIFPGKGQLFSFSIFYKDFKNPIELQALANNTNQYNNARSAKNKGIELEYRTLASSIFGTEDNKLLSDLTFFTNLSIIRSSVDTSNLVSIATETPLQGQSPYVLNVGLQYSNIEKGWSFTGNFNRVGDRIFIQANQANGVDVPAIWEKARTFLDFQVSKLLFKNKMELKLNLQNALAQDLDYYQNVKGTVDKIEGLNSFINNILTGDSQNVNGYNSKTDDLLWSTKFAPTFSFNVTYNF